MGSAYDDAARNREQDDDDAADRSRAEAPGPKATQRKLARTKTLVTYPTGGLGHFFAMETAIVTGLETEGGAGTITYQGDTFYAMLANNVTPASGTLVECTFVPHRWIFFG